VTWYDKANELLKQMEIRHLCKDSPPTDVTPVGIAKVNIIYPFGSFIYRELDPRDESDISEFTREQVIERIIVNLKKLFNEESDCDIQRYTMHYNLWQVSQ
jgi:hypothetical protein